MSIRPYNPIEGRIVRNKSRLPLRWKGLIGRGLFASCDIPVAPGGALCAKLIVFKRTWNMRGFWRRQFGSDLGDDCCGVATRLSDTFVQFGDESERTTTLVDPTYFCAIGLCIGYLNMEIICHESCHAGLYYAERVRRRVFSRDGDNDSEEVCYPTGRIARAINSFLHESGAYEAQEARR